MSRSLEEKLSLGRATTERLERLTNDHIELALVDIDPEDLATAETVAVDAKDRHVLAAAISADADIVLTENTRHFPREWMTNWDIEIPDAGELLARLGECLPDKFRAAHEKAVRYSPKSESEVLARLEASCQTEYVGCLVSRVRFESCPVYAPNTPAQAVQSAQTASR